MPTYCQLAARLTATLLCIVTAVGAADERTVARIQTLSRAHDLHKLRAMSRQILQSNSRLVKAAYFVARYTGDPAFSSADFEAGFPTDPEGINDLYAVTPAITGKHGTFAFDRLAILADRDRPVALRKLLLVVAESDGALGEFVADRLSVVAKSRPARVLQAIAGLPAVSSRKIVTNPLPWCDSVNLINRVKPSSASIRLLKSSIKKSAKRC